MWNNRILLKDGLFGVSEVFYDDGSNKPRMWTVPDEWFETVDELVQHYTLIVNDINISKGKILQETKDKGLIEFDRKEILDNN